MSLVQDIATYIEANSTFVMDTDLFVGAETVDTPPGSVVVREFTGSTRNESGLEERSVQILSADRGYINAEIALNTVFNLLANMPGFVSEDLSNIFFVSVLSLPGFVDRDASGKFVFSSGLLFKMKSVLDIFVDNGGVGGIPVGYPVLNSLIDDVVELQAGEAVADDTYMRIEDYDADADDIVDEAESIDGGAF